MMWVEGGAKVLKNMELYKRLAIDAAAKLLVLRANRAMAKSVEICPWDTTFLRSTHYVKPKAEIKNGTLMVELGYNCEYAWYVHEDPHAQHKPGTSYHFLKEPLDVEQQQLQAYLEMTVKTIGFS